MNEELILTVYTTGPSCGKCRMTKIMLEAKNIPYREVNINEHPDAYLYVTEDLGYSTAPVVVVDDQDHWCDLRPDHIERIAKRAILPSDATREARSPAREDRSPHKIALPAMRLGLEALRAERS